MVYLHGNEAAWEIQSFQELPLVVYSRVNGKKWLPRLPEDEIAEFPKTEQKKKKRKT